ncbi:MAG: N-acetylglucosamine-6-phosphate deacetylase [Actinomycetes bacterium]
MTSMIINAPRAVVEGAMMHNVGIHITDGVITKIGATVDDPDQSISGTLIPGFVDIHCHGGGGKSFSSLVDEDIETVISTHRKFGTTSQLASLVTEPIAALEKQIRHLLPFVRRGEIAGIHLEGPYLSKAKCGAHDPKLLRTPDLEEISDLIAVGEGAIMMITIAPELPNALDAIQLITDSGIVAAIGHSNADFETARKAIDAGASVITHFYNGLPSLSHRQPTVTVAGLLDEFITLELILDGHHVNASAVELLLKNAPDRVVLVTDAMSAAGGSEGRYKIGELDVEVKNGRAELLSNRSLAGSTLTMDQAFLRLVHHHGKSIEEASHATSVLPARTLGISYVGEIKEGFKAHFVELSEDEERISQVLRFQ